MHVKFTILIVVKNNTVRGGVVSRISLVCLSFYAEYVSALDAGDHLREVLPPHQRRRPVAVFSICHWDELQLLLYSSIPL